eukprot:TRINITY_DN3259_c0_g2_i2.p1 TRINITY_DN3259_c0_g2~~TRINITY_DN3259_c0_g2_i2.p1  ORF type:complete len:1091 (+),score=285.77 TRINITY_DN3259_c0_g2_i2:75-3347(+)
MEQDQPEESDDQLERRASGTPPVKRKDKNKAQEATLEMTELSEQKSGDSSTDQYPPSPVPDRSLSQSPGIAAALMAPEVLLRSKKKGGKEHSYADYHSSSFHESTYMKSPKNSQTSQRRTQGPLEIPDEDSDSSPDERIEAYFEQTQSSADGLTTEEASLRLARDGPNSLPEVKMNPLSKFASFLWSPMSWALQAAALIAIVLVNYVDFILILVLLLINGVIGYFEDRSSGYAIAGLKRKLEPTCKCFRDGTLDTKFPSERLVRGDVILLRLGDVAPADVILLQGDGLKVDRSSLNGETLLKDIKASEEVWAGSIIKHGEQKAVVHATGLHTFFGHASSRVGRDHHTGHFHRVLRSIGWLMFNLIIVWIVIELVVQFGYRHAPCFGVHVNEQRCNTMANILVLIIGGIPIGMPTVLSIMLALGARQLAKRKAIVTRLTAVEELAAMDLLCSDKTGILTKNELAVHDPICYTEKWDVDDVLFQAGLSCNPNTNDAIDVAVFNACSTDQREHLKDYKIFKYFPFDPVGKKTVTVLQAPDGHLFACAKGAPQFILAMASNKAAVHRRVNADIDKLARNGYRSLGIAVGNCDSTGTVDPKSWKMTGNIPMLDPPRGDSKATLEKCEAMGLAVKMITGDQLAIAKTTGELLGMQVNMFTANVIERGKTALVESVTLDDLIESADGFAEVTFEHKYEIVTRMQRRGHVVGITGEGVKDRTALRQADIGIAVSTSTAAARSAADIVLTAPGLSVIVDAIEGSRAIFQLMKNYCIYITSVAIRAVLTFGILTVAWDWYFPTLGIVLLAIVNELSMITVACDSVRPRKASCRWSLLEILALAVFFAVYLTASTIVLFHVAYNTTWFHDTFGMMQLNAAQMRGLVYLQVSISNLATSFATRSHMLSLLDRPGWLMAVTFIIAQAAASVIGAYGLNNYPGNGDLDYWSQSINFGGAGWAYVLAVWIHCIIWYIPMDLCKILILAGVRGQLRLYTTQHHSHRSLNLGHPYFGEHHVVERRLARRIGRDVLHGADLRTARSEVTASFRDHQSSEIERRSTPPNSIDGKKSFERSMLRTFSRPSDELDRNRVRVHDNNAETSRV